MNLPDDELLELNALCNALIDDAITDTERARLEKMLAASDEARRFYVRAMALSASLFDYAGEMQSDAPDLTPQAGRDGTPCRPPGERSEAAGAADAAHPPPTASLRSPRTARSAIPTRVADDSRRIVRVPAWAWTIGSLGAAACVALAFWLGGAAKRDAANEVASAEQESSDDSVARLSGAKDCRWSGAELPPGAELRRGQRIELQSGFAEITFDCGAQVTLEGPASIDVSSAWDAVLRRGTLKANVPHEAIGFRISNPSVEVTDLGTEFSMVADEGGATEVFVLKGAVEAAPRDAAGNAGESVVLRETQSRRFAVAGGTDVRDRDVKLAKFMRKVALVRFTRPANYVHWSFDEEAGPALAQTIGLAQDGFTAQLEPAGDALSAGTRTDGRWARALQLDGKLFAKAPFPGIGKRAPRTVAFWINVPADAPLPDAGAMLAWPLGTAGRGIEIGWNRNPLDGALGALRTSAARVSLTGATPLRDGRWHHLAVVFSPKQKADAAPQIRQYVDGRLDGLAPRRNGRRARGTLAEDAVPAGSAEEALWIGRGLGGRESAEHFRGAMDELFVADRVLTPPEIRHLMTHNKPATPETLAAQ